MREWALRRAGSTKSCGGSPLLEGSFCDPGRLSVGKVSMTCHGEARLFPMHDANLGNLDETLRARQSEGKDTRHNILLIDAHYRLIRV